VFILRKICTSVL